MLKFQATFLIFGQDACGYLWPPDFYEWPVAYITFVFLPIFPLSSHWWHSHWACKTMKPVCACPQFAPSFLAYFTLNISGNRGSKRCDMGQSISCCQTSLIRNWVVKWPEGRIWVARQSFDGRWDGSRCTVHMTEFHFLWEPFFPVDSALSWQALCRQWCSGTGFSGRRVNWVHVTLSHCFGLVDVVNHHIHVSGQRKYDIWIMNTFQMHCGICVHP